MKRKNYFCLRFFAPKNFNVFINIISIILLSCCFSFKTNAQIENCSFNDLNSLQTGFLQSGTAQLNAECVYRDSNGNLTNYELFNTASSVVLITSANYNPNIPGNSSFGTGVLVNSSISPGIPYVLTAQHIIEQINSANINLNDIQFHFNYNNDCGNNCQTSNGNLDFGLTDCNVNKFEKTGAQLILELEDYDLALLKLNQYFNYPEVSYYSGWDKSIPDANETFYKFHHPKGDTKKYSTGSVNLSYDSVIVNNPNTQTGLFLNNWTPDHPQVISSGSPVFNSNHNVVGIQSAGCENTVHNHIGSLELDEISSTYTSSSQLNEKLGNQITVYGTNVNPTIAINNSLLPTSLEFYLQNSSCVNVKYGTNTDEMVAIPQLTSFSVNPNQGNLISNLEQYLPVGIYKIMVEDCNSGQSAISNFFVANYNYPIELPLTGPSVFFSEFCNGPNYNIQIEGNSGFTYDLQITFSYNGTDIPTTYNFTENNSSNNVLVNIPIGDEIIVNVAGTINSQSVSFSEIFTGSSCASPPTITAPTIQATNLSTYSSQTDLLHINWNRGNGDKVLVTATICGTYPTEPSDGIDYTYNQNFNNASQLGTTKIIYEGTNSSMYLLGLDASTCYSIRVYEFNGTNANTKYLAPGLPGTGQTASDLSIDFDWDINPIIAGVYVDFDWTTSNGNGLTSQSWTFEGADTSANSGNTGDNVYWNAPGTYTVTLVAANSSLNQSVTISKEITVLDYAAFQPDLQFVSSHLSQYNATLDQDVIVDYVIQNLGQDEIFASTAEIYISDNQVIDGNDPLLKTVCHNEHLYQNGQVVGDESITIPDDLNLGSYYIIVKINTIVGSNDTPESNLTNNIISIPITIVASLPDLIIQNVVLSSNTVQSGEEFTVDFEIRNIGNASASSQCKDYNIVISDDNILDESDINYFNGYSVNSGSHCITGTIWPTGPNSVKYITRDISINSELPSGNYYLIFAVDTHIVNSSNDIIESNEQNNFYSIPIVISNPNQPTLQVSNLTASSINNNSVTLNWQSGNGDKTIIIASNNNFDLIDGINYNFTTSDFSAASLLHYYYNGNLYYAQDNKIIYNGTGSQCTVSNLGLDSTYFFIAYTYNDNNGNTDYLQAKPDNVILYNSNVNQNDFSIYYDYFGNPDDFEIRPINDFKYNNDKSVGIACGQSGSIYITNDECNSFKMQRLPSGNNRLYELEYIGNTIYAFSENGLCFVSSDNGNNWTKTIIDSNFEFDRCRDIHFKNDLIGYVILEKEFDDSYSLYKTSNGGSTWMDVYSTAEDLISVDGIGSNLWVSGKNSTLLKSNDDGNSWITLNSNLNGNIGNIQFLNTNLGYCNAYSNLETKIYKTIDGGTTWNSVFSEFETYTHLDIMHFTDELNGYVISYDWQNPKIYRTQNGGQTWNSIATFNQPMTIYGLHLASSDELWFYGNMLGKIDLCEPQTFYLDNDGDGFGNLSNSISECIAPINYVTNALDCNDNNANINPGALENCNLLDDNCNLTIDEGCISGCTDIIACNFNYLANNDDGTCTYPEPEICDGIDNNCNGQIDEGVLTTYFYDADNDGFGDVNNFTEDCTQPNNYVINSLDCDDTNPNINPNANEVCNNSIDENCDNQLNENCNYGCTDINACNYDLNANIDDGNCQTLDCNNICGGNAIPSSSCNDNDLCTFNDVFNSNCNCIGTFQDDDGDGVCDNEDICPGIDDATCIYGCTYSFACNYNPNAVIDDLTCIFPSTEICDGIDNNCNGEIDEGYTTTYYADNDNDGFGDYNNSIESCEPVPNYVTNWLDCDDNYAFVTNNGISGTILPNGIQLPNCNFITDCPDDIIYDSQVNGGTTENANISITSNGANIGFTSGNIILTAGEEIILNNGTTINPANGNSVILQGGNCPE